MYLVKRNKIYHLIYNDNNGKLVSKSTRQKTKSEASEFVKNYFASQKVIQKLIQEISFKDFYKFYREYSSSRFSKSYQEFVKYAFAQFQRVLPEKIILKKISPNHIENFIQLKLSETGEKIVSGYLRTLQAAFERAVELSYLQENVFKKIKKLKLTQNSPLFLSMHEFQKVVNNEKDNQLKLVYKLAVYTGMRMGEIRFLKWSSIDFDKNIIQVINHEHFETKSKKSRIIPIHSILKKDLLCLWEENYLDEFIFSNRGEVLKRNYLSTRFKKVIRRTGLNDKFHFHSLRHTFASWLVQKGVSIYQVSKLLGHASVKTTEIYSHLNNSDLKQSVELLE